MKSKYQLEQQLIFDKVDLEISRIFDHLNIDSSFKEVILDKLIATYYTLRPGTIYKNIDKLLPLVIYFYFHFKSKSIPFNETKLIKVSNINKKEYNTFKIQILNFLPRNK